MAHAIINGRFKNVGPGQVAPSQVGAQEKNTELYKHYLEIARRALGEHMNSNDPLQGRTQYNHRYKDDVGNRIVKTSKGNIADPDQPVFQRYGPFPNVAGKPAYIVIYGKGPTPAKQSGEVGPIPLLRPGSGQ